MTFNNYIQNINTTVSLEENNYYVALGILERIDESDLTEGFLDSLANGVKDKINFFTEFANLLGRNINDLVIFFKNTKVFQFFKLIKFSLEDFFSIVKKGFQAYRTLQLEISKYVHSTKVGQWTQKELTKLDEFLQKNPTIKKLGGVAVGGILIYIWMNMSFTGDWKYDFDFSDILNALVGKFTLTELFSGPEGTRMLLLLVTGVIGLTFPWPGALTTKFAIAIVHGLSKIIKQNLIKV